MALSTQDRTRTSAQFMRDIKESFGITKADLLAAIGGLDDYLDTNAAAINTAIPQPARSALTAAQKASLVAYIALRRAGRLKAEED